MPSPARLIAAALIAALAACRPPSADSPDPFTATGELIALSGGDSGARNACFGCHGIRGEGDGVSTPRLAGLEAGYLQRQLEAYAIGLRTHKPMRAIAKHLSQADRRAVANYYAGMPATVEPAAGLAPNPVGARLYLVGDPDRDLHPCAACHGAEGGGIGPANPALAGQPAGYITNQLELWRLGNRRSDPLNQMLDISQKLTDREVSALSAYVRTLAATGPESSRAPAPSPPRHHPD